MQHIYLIFLISILPATLLAQGPTLPKTPSLSVAPFYAPADPDYGVFITDRLITELSQYTYFLPQRRHRFELKEASQLDTTTIKRIAQETSYLPQEIQQAITTPTDYLISGWVETTGIHQIHISLTDLQTHQIIWQEILRDNLANFWMGDTNQGLGDALVLELCQKLGYGSQETASQPTNQLPQKIVWHPLSCQAYPSLASDINQAIDQALTKDKPFQIIFKDKADIDQKADAILCGSILALGKDNKVSAMGVALRLVEVPSGKILWTTVRNGRILWRWDKRSDVVNQVGTNLMNDLSELYNNTYP